MKKPKIAKPRNLVQLALILRKPKAGPMKDRRAARGGARNKVRDLMEDS